MINETVASENNKWKMNLAPEQKKLLNAILSLENIKMLSVDKVASISSVPGCWIILAFNSSDVTPPDGTPTPPGTLEITKKLLEYFDEKCHVAVLDGSYPSVKKLLFPFVRSFPSLLIRGAGKISNSPRVV